MLFTIRTTWDDHGMKIARRVIGALGLGLAAAAGWFALAPVTSLTAAHGFGGPRSCIPLRDMLASDHVARFISCGPVVGTHLAWANVLLFATLVALATGGLLLGRMSSRGRAARRALAEEEGARREGAGQPTHGNHAT